jgi:hypothetical protein
MHRILFHIQRKFSREFRIITTVSSCRLKPIAKSQKHAADDMTTWIQYGIAQPNAARLHFKPLGDICSPQSQASQRFYSKEASDQTEHLPVLQRK